MQKNFVKELEWRGMIHNIMPETEEQLLKELTSGYVGIDPTADSLHIGHLVGIMMLKHLQEAGHQPIALLGGATGMIGDPSGKSKERNLLDLQALRHNQESIKKQLALFLDFDTDAGNKALLVNNYDWMSEFSFLDFIRDIGKHITVNYMMAKESVKKRINADDSAAEGMSFTEFSYQLVQGYDFLYLYQNHNCRLQMGGADQWGNITTGTELIRRKERGSAFALTCPLITKADGGKFGKTETGNIWLDPEKTSPYHFYQFWLNTSDADAEKYIKIFTLFSKEKTEEMISKHQEAPHERLLQKTLAKDLTARVHGDENLKMAIDASAMLFGKNTTELLKKLDNKTILSVFDGVPKSTVERGELESTPLLEILSSKTGIFKSNGEARRMLKENAVSLNKQKIGENYQVTEEDLLNSCYILIQKGKKNYFLIEVV